MRVKENILGQEGQRVGRRDGVEREVGVGGDGHGGLEILRAVTRSVRESRKSQQKVSVCAVSTRQRPSKPKR